MKITSDSHTDHALSPEHVTFIEFVFGTRDAFFIETVAIPPYLPPLPCNLHGPATGGKPIQEAEVVYLRRGERPEASRMVVREPVPTRLLTVIGGPHGNEPCILYTAYGGPLAPREPWDLSLDDEGREESAAFWAIHALGMAPGAIIKMGDGSHYLDGQALCCGEHLVRQGDVVACRFERHDGEPRICFDDDRWEPLEDFDRFTRR